MREKQTRLHSHPAHPPAVPRHNEPVILLVTVCTVAHEPLLASPEAHAALLQAWKDTSHWHVGDYVIMPDHVHFFCTPGISEYPPIRRWAGHWKRRVGQIQPSLRSSFLQDCWDTQMRNAAHYEEKLSYVRRNPERKDLVKDWKDWPYRGHVNQLSWD